MTIDNIKIVMDGMPTSTTTSRPDIDQEILEYTKEMSSSLKVIET